MTLMSEFNAAVRFKMSPELLRWFTSYAPKNDGKKLPYTDENGIYYFEYDDLIKFNSHLLSPWQKPKSGTRPHIPEGISAEIKREAHFRCPACNTNVGEIAHIESVSSILNNHPHNLIYLCPTHHTVYDYGFKYKNISKEEVVSLKRAIQIFQCNIWKLKCSLITSYLTLINIIGRVQRLDIEILKLIPAEEVEGYFGCVIKRIEDVNRKYISDPEYSKAISEINSKKYESYREHAYKYMDVMRKLRSQKSETGFSACPICNGDGFTDFFELCPPCNGEGMMTDLQIKTTDYEEYHLTSCPLCSEKGATEEFEVCPPCDGMGKLTKGQIKNIDFSQFDFEDCPICKGAGSTDEFEVCPPCEGTGKLTKGQKRNIDFSQFDFEDCPLCEV